MTGEQVERVAKAIWQSLVGVVRWEDHPQSHEEYRAAARAAISALTVTPQEAAKVLLALEDETPAQHAIHDELCACYKGRECHRTDDYMMGFRAALRAISEDSHE